MVFHNSNKGVHLENTILGKIDLGKYIKISLTHLSGIKYNEEEGKCEGCSFKLGENSNLFEVICDHIAFNSGCQIAIKYLKTFIFGVVRKNDGENETETSDDDNKYLNFKWGDKDLKIKNSCLLNNTELHEAEELDWVFLEKYCEGMKNVMETNERWRLLSFKSWQASNMASPLALAHSGFVQLDAFTSKCVFCNLCAKWREADVVHDVHSCRSPNCPMVSRRAFNNHPISSVLLKRFRMKQFLKEYGRIYDDSHPSDLPATVKTLWTLFKSDKACVMWTDVSLFEHISPQLSENLQGRFRKQLQSADVTNERQSLLEEDAQLRELKLCRLCLDQPMDTVFLPCGHFMSCAACSKKLKTCALCRNVIRGTVLGFVP